MDFCPGAVQSITGAKCQEDSIFLLYNQPEMNAIVKLTVLSSLVTALNLSRDGAVVS
jgi:hypothetical protein